MGLTNTFATLPGFIGPAVVGAITYRNVSAAYCFTRRKWSSVRRRMISSFQDDNMLLMCAMCCERKTLIGWGDRKGKERKSIYIAPFCTKVHTKRSGMDHTVLPANNTMPAFPSFAFTRCHHHSNCGSRHPIAAHYSFIDPERMKCWVGLVGWPIADGLPT